MVMDAGLLPRDVLLTIFSYCSYYDLVNSVQYVCSWWQEVVAERCLWRDVEYQPFRVSRKEIIDLFKRSPHLRIVDLNRVQLDREMFRELINNCLSLEQLSISWYNGYGDIVFSDDHKLLTNVKVLKILCSSDVFTDFVRLHKKFPNVDHLELNYVYTRMKDLVPYLRKKRQSLHTLSLECRTDDDYCVLPYLQGFTNLKTLSLVNLCDADDFLGKDMEDLVDVTSLTLCYSYVDLINPSKSVFKYFPNVVNLAFCSCDTNGDLIRELLLCCPKIKKLTSSSIGGLGWGVLVNDNLKQMNCLKYLTHLNIWFNHSISDEGLVYLKQVSTLTHLDLYDCEQVTLQSLKTICEFDKLQVLKFDLGHCVLPPGLIIQNLKNSNLQFLFYNCTHVKVLEYLREQHISVGVIECRHRR